MTTSNDRPYEAQPTEGVSGAPEGGSACDSPGNLLVNCGFETGDFTGWVTQDLTSPFFPLSVDIAGVTPGFSFFESAPTEGVFAALHGFDGDGPGQIEVGQDLLLPPGSTATLTFDYRAAWDTTFGATLPRTFSVDIEPAGGGVAMESTEILVVDPGTTNTDTGPLTATVDLSDFAGQSVRVNMVWDVPEDFTGPAFVQVDNASVVATSASVPTLQGAGLVLLVAVLAGGAAWMIRKRSAA